ncbi:mandelate racemase/muconate lactonizing enzyme family protein [Nonomuraea sp. KC401]|nr:mandelate racemase/muconate lactonizing enzyme family protein [Nonomuraea sp. K271]TLF62692.1 mandelate racemase/muconate lactonizing enzyme family protein [Nonomuraea sp. KC401]
METVRTRTQSNLCFVRLHTDSGQIGLGETFYGAESVETYLHEQVAPQLVGLADPSPEAVGRLLTPYTGYQGGGVETRGNGAVDVALWDLLGQIAGLPLTDLLGGAVRTSIPIYNTCAGSRYVSATSRQRSDNWGLPEQDEPYEDLRAFLTRPAELARELRAEGYAGMKIWPFDRAAERNDGLRIDEAELAEAIGIVAAIREAVGTDLELMIELHGLWYPGAAARICRALAPYRPTWVEDPLRADAVAALGGLRREVDIPFAVGETCVGRRGFLPLLQENAVDVVTVDPTWTGGLTEARKVATLADAFGKPVAPHDCTGPVSLAVATHLSCSQPNGLIQETARAFLRTWYPELVAGLPEVAEGRITPSRAPGHGVRLRPELLAAPTTTTRESGR